jgi:hypothetical protein
MVASLDQTTVRPTFDTIKALLVFLTRDEVPARASILHSAIYELCKVKKWQPLLGGYFFEKRGSFPFSIELQSDLINLEQAGQLSTPNPDFVRYKRQPKLTNTFKRYGQSKFTAKEIASLKEMARALERTLP